MMFNSIDEIKEANESAGKHWFSEGAMAFFKTIIHHETINNNYFITSEKPPHGERGYCIRHASECGSVETVGEVLQYKSKQVAINALDDILESEGLA